MDDMTDITDPATDEWRTYDEFAAGIDTYRLPSTDLSGTRLTLTLDDGSSIDLAFDAHEVVWNGVRDPYDAVAVRDDVVFVNLPLTSREREAVTIVYSTTTHRALVAVSRIGEEEVEGEPRVKQEFHA